MRTATNITTSIVSTHSLFVWFIDHKNSNYNIYKKELKVTDIHNKLLIISALIKDIIKKYHFLNEKDSKKDSENIDITIQKYIDKTAEEITNDNFLLINYETKIDVFTEIPNSIKLALFSVLEIITILNNEISKIHMKIHDHHKRWISYIYSIAIQQEMDTILEHSIIFDKRLNLLFQILSAY
jgi:predicted nucleotidyltransferase